MTSSSSSAEQRVKIVVQGEGYPSTQNTTTTQGQSERPETANQRSELAFPRGDLLVQMLQLRTTVHPPGDGNRFHIRHDGSSAHLHAALEEWEAEGSTTWSLGPMHPFPQELPGEGDDADQAAIRHRPIRRTQ